MLHWSQHRDASLVHPASCPPKYGSSAGQESTLGRFPSVQKMMMLQLEGSEMANAVLMTSGHWNRQDGSHTPQVANARSVHWRETASKSSSPGHSCVKSESSPLIKHVWYFLQSLVSGTRLPVGDPSQVGGSQDSPSTTLC